MQKFGGREVAVGGLGKAVSGERRPRSAASGGAIMTTNACAIFFFSLCDTARDGAGFTVLNRQQ